MKKVIKLLMMGFMIFIAGCTTTIEVEIPNVDSVELTPSKTAIYADGTDFSDLKVKAYDKDGNLLNLNDYNVEYKLIGASGGDIDEQGVFTATTAGTYTVQVKVDGVYSSSKTISARRGLKIINAAAFSIHLITWEPTGNNKYWFTPETQYSQFYPYDNGYVPTLKSGTSCQQEVIAGTSYLYFVMTGTSGFGYYRTTTKVAVGTAYGAVDGRTFELSNGTPSKQTDSDQNDLPAPLPILREVKVSKAGVRTIIREIEIIKQ